MRQYAPLLLALFVGAHAASIPDKIEPELEKKIVIDDDKPPAENVSSEPVLVDPANTVIDVENNLRNNLKPEDIPVKVIVEEAQPVVKSAELEPAYEVIEEEIKRPVVDLRNPGPPQHQEHETQNPEHYEDVERTASSVKEEIQQSKFVLRQSIQGVANGIQNWYANNEQINSLQNSINSLQESFSSQLQKLNDTLQNFIKPDSKPLSLEEEKSTKINFENIETSLKTLENNFKAGVQSLSEGVQVVATLREEGVGGAGNSGSSSTAAPPSVSNPFQFFIQMIGDLQSSMTTGLSNMSQAVNNFVIQNQPNITLPNLQSIFQPTTAAPLADTPVDGSSTTARPSPWQNIQTSFNNLFNPNQTPQNVQNDQSTQAPTGPFGIPQLPIITSIVNLIQRPGTSTVKPTEASQSNSVPAVAPPSNPVPEGTNAVPAPVTPEEIKVKPEPEKKPEPSINPIRKIIENSPIVQGINVAVQRIQSANNPDKPRDTTEEAEAVKSEEIKPQEAKVEEIKDEELNLEEVRPEEIKVEKAKPEIEKEEVEKDETEQEKGGWFYGPPRPSGNSGGTDDSSGRLETPSEESQKVSENKEEVKDTEQISDKTE